MLNLIIKKIIKLNYISTIHLNIDHLMLRVLCFLNNPNIIIVITIINNYNNTLLNFFGYIYI
jgi:hypothetical protein